MKTLTHAEWLAEAERRFGPDPNDWKFICPNCGYVQSGKMFAELETLGIIPVGKKERVLGFSCIGRFDTRIPDGQVGDWNTKKQPCNWTLGGLFSFHQTEVLLPSGKQIPVFEFAEAPA